MEQRFTAPATEKVGGLCWGDYCLKDMVARVLWHLAQTILRGDSETQVFIGIGKAPYYQEWEWKIPLVDYGPEHGGPRPAKELMTYGLGGPILIRLRDGRLVGAGRALGPERDDGHATLFLVDPEKNTMTIVVRTQNHSS